MHDPAFDSTLQMPCAVLGVGAFFKQSILGVLFDTDDELLAADRSCGLPSGSPSF
jgi:hypothetical protein